MIVKPVTLASRLHRATEFSDPHTGILYRVSRDININIQLLLVAAQSRLLQDVLGKGTNNSVPQNGSHPGIGTIRDAGQTDLKRKLPSREGEMEKEMTQKMGWKRKVGHLSPLPDPNPIKAIIKWHFHSPNSRNQKGESGRRGKTNITNQPKHSDILKLNRHFHLYSMQTKKQLQKNN